MKVSSSIDNKTVNVVLLSIDVEIGHVVDEAFSLEVEGCVTQDSVTSMGFECDKKMVDILICHGCDRLKASRSIHMCDRLEFLRSCAICI